MHMSKRGPVPTLNTAAFATLREFLAFAKLELMNYLTRG